MPAPSKQDRVQELQIAIAAAEQQVKDWTKTRSDAEKKAREYRRQVELLKSELIAAMTAK